MLQTVATMISMMMAGGGALVIAVSLAEEWEAMHRAMLGGSAVQPGRLPARTRRIASPRRARMVRFTPETAPSRAVA